MATATATATNSMDKLDSAALLAAMESELARSLEGLRVPEVPAPYYLAYTLRREEQMRLKGAYGALARDRHAERNRVFVDIRVGDEAFDNVCDGGLTVDAGRMRAEGEVAALLKSTDLPLYRLAAPDLDALEAHLRTLDDIESVRSDDDALLVRTALPAHELNTRAFEAGLALSMLAPVERNLEDVFLEVVG